MTTTGISDDDNRFSGAAIASLRALDLLSARLRAWGYQLCDAAAALDCPVILAACGARLPTALLIGTETGDGSLCFAAPEEYPGVTEAAPALTALVMPEYDLVLFLSGAHRTWSLSASHLPVLRASGRDCLNAVIAETPARDPGAPIEEVDLELASV